MNDQDNLSFKERYAKFKDYYDKIPVALVEDFNPNIKLLPYQKIILNAIVAKDKTVSFFNARMNQKLWLSNMGLEWMKTFRSNFEVWSPEGIDVYENGVLVKTLKHKKGNDK